MPLSRCCFIKTPLFSFLNDFLVFIKFCLPFSLLFLLSKTRCKQLTLSYIIVCLYWLFSINSFSLLIILSVLSFYLLMLSFFDADYFLLPNTLTYWLIFLGLLCNYSVYGLVPFNHAFYGFLGGVGLFYGIYLWGYFICKKCVLGFGDVKLFGAIGAWCGFEKLPYILLLGSFLGLSVYCAVLITTKDHIKKVAFGSCLSFSTLMVLGFNFSSYNYFN
ncbi:MULTISPECIES: prepilin peptidase [Proteus]|uniref:prepilin peptidase n=2 Tax=Morganellaceae TaxID=1903414 RepID=UPI000952D705|nr:MULTISPECIES: A24 family peptidase [Proteus]MCM2367823.1 A24 family peptidase [Proteus sp. FZP2095]MCO4180242.1 A24 family peptidase [Proteus terrae]MCO4189444.1 A24 family peptidase [Proteus terrae]QGW02242.1 prepilin peptidase [Proteus terrae subsp. cibarius]QIF97304.1 prepilin peptidase [Proteus terrae subsp. cibarius]